MLGDHIVLAATHTWSIPAFTFCSRRASPPFGWYSLRLPTEGWPGWVDLGGWLYTEIGFRHLELNPGLVTHPSTNRAWRWVTLLIETKVLPLRQTATVVNLSLSSSLTPVLNLVMLHLVAPNMFDLRSTLQRLSAIVIMKTNESNWTTCVKSKNYSDFATCVSPSVINCNALRSLLLSLIDHFQSWHRLLEFAVTVNRIRWHFALFRLGSKSNCLRQHTFSRTVQRYHSTSDSGAILYKLFWIGLDWNELKQYPKHAQTRWNCTQQVTRKSW